jgi:hypothetical protein
MQGKILVQGGRASSASEEKASVKAERGATDETVQACDERPAKTTASLNAARTRQLPARQWVRVLASTGTSWRARQRDWWRLSPQAAHNEEAAGCTRSHDKKVNAEQPFRREVREGTTNWVYRTDTSVPATRQGRKHTSESGTRRDEDGEHR